MKTYRLVFFIVIVLLLLPNPGEAQCAMCKATVESSVGQANSIAGGLNKGILYIMAVPYLLLTFIFRKQLIIAWKLWRGKYVPEDEL
jgi:hypothetical protein